MLIMAVTGLIWGPGGVSWPSWLVGGLRLLTASVGSASSASPISALAASTSSAPIGHSGHLRLILGTEGGQCLIEADLGGHGRHGDLLGGQVDLIGGLKNLLVSILREIHVTYVSPYIYG